jgi:hypothetical protein
VTWRSTCASIAGRREAQNARGAARGGPGAPIAWAAAAEREVVVHEHRAGRVGDDAQQLDDAATAEREALHGEHGGARSQAQLGGLFDARRPRRDDLIEARQLDAGRDERRVRAARDLAGGRERRPVDEVERIPSRL